MYGSASLFLLYIMQTKLCSFIKVFDTYEDICVVPFQIRHQLSWNCKLRNFQSEDIVTSSDFDLLVAKSYSSLVSRNVSQLPAFSQDVKTFWNFKCLDLLCKHEKRPDDRISRGKMSWHRKEPNKSSATAST